MRTDGETSRSCCCASCPVPEMPGYLPRVLAALRTAAPDLDGTAMAEVLWLASRMASDAAAGQDLTEPRSVLPATASVPPAPTPDHAGTAPMADAPVVQSGTPQPDTAGTAQVTDHALHVRRVGGPDRLRGTAVSVPRAAALPYALELTRALRPWKRRWKDGRRTELDVNLTVAGYARSGHLIPAFTPAPERWFDLTFVIDRSPGMRVWRETVKEFTALVARTGAFRTLRIRDLLFRTDGSPISPGQLGSPDGRTLVVLVSDCAASAWRRPEVWQLVHAWAGTTPIALLNPLPTRLWRGTGLDLPLVRVTPTVLGPYGARLPYDAPPLLDQDAFGGPDSWQPVPVLSMSPHSIGRWSRALMRNDPAGCTAVLVPLTGRLPAHSVPATQSVPPEVRAHGFLRTASTAAVRLTVLCAAFDRLPLAVLHLVREALVQDAATADVAEMVTSGLFEITGEGDSIELSIIGAAQEVLRERLAVDDVWQMRDALDRHVAKRLGGQGLTSVVPDPSASGELYAELHPFARASRQTLELLGVYTPERGAAPETTSHPDPQGLTASPSCDAASERTGRLFEKAASAPGDEPRLVSLPEHDAQSGAKLALRLALALLPTDRQPTPQEVTACVDSVERLLADQGTTVDRTALLRDLQAQVAVFQESAALLENDHGHLPWLGRDTDTHQWDFWERYERFLREIRGVPPLVARRLDESTHDVLARLEDPRRPGTWRRTGLVIGQPQSGKTSHYIGLAAKAIDAGYRLIVIITGPHNALRAQTQLRVDEGLLGFDTQYQMLSEVPKDAVGRRFGVGALPHAKALIIASMTNSSEKGDFNPRLLHFRRFDLRERVLPVVFVVKRNPRVMENLKVWLTEQYGTIDHATGEVSILDIPIFIVDDDVDRSYGLLTSAPDDSLSVTGRSIRKFLATFKRSAYVGYASTPLAGMFLETDMHSKEVGPSLFPDSFLYSLRAPSNYLGPERLFSTRSEGGRAMPTEALPLVRHVTDYEGWVPSQHSSTHVPGAELPDSLSEAIDAFILSCAARRARGQISVHNSMLVTVSRFVRVQAQVRDQVEARVRFIAEILRDRRNPAAVQQVAAFRDLWLSDFSPTSEAFPSSEAMRISWEEVAKNLGPVIRKIQIGAVNGGSREVLSYFENRSSGLNVIVIAGTQLPLGLTLEGLTIGYILRSSPSYDSLLHLGRWFGYRVGYEDLCRLYTTPELESAYAEVATVAGELHQSIEETARLGLTPRQFGLRIRSQLSPGE
ncbi:Z1 domain-containing protein [Streptomyces sp. SM13]|uniref:Z1 domain-containing protein n=1 Tax=Streptomyces sp. SM13 TaxID=1983803 RepID=UPI000CD49D68|nr:Z1 domain-containing protein [Streptomyces sp. SM13]